MAQPTSKAVPSRDIEAIDLLGIKLDRAKTISRALAGAYKDHPYDPPPVETTVLALQAVADLIDEAQRIIAPVINAPPSSDAAEPPRP